MQRLEVVDKRSDGWTEAVCNRYRNWNGRWIHLRYALEHLAVGRVTVIGRRKVGAGNMPAAEKIGGYHSARAKIIGPLDPPGGITGPVMRNELVAQIHPRMPAILPEQHHAAWLGQTDDGNLKDLLVPYPADQMRMWKISPPVNSPKNDDPSLWEPLHAEPTQTTSDALELLRE